MSFLFFFYVPQFHFISLLLFLFIYLFIFILERGGGGGRKRERKTLTWETSIGCLPNTPWPGTKPATQACALTRNRTGDLSVCRMMPNQLSHTGQGHFISFIYFSLSYLALALLIFFNMKIVQFIKPILMFNCPCLRFVVTINFYSLLVSVSSFHHT